MSLIIVIEQERSRAERVSATLGTEGWIVEICQNLEAARQRVVSNPPDLVVVGEGPDAEAAVAAFSSSAGGPGTVVLGDSIAGADGSVDLSSSDEQIRLAVRRCLSTLSRAAVAQAAQEAASSGGQFTSEDIFGDMLAEVEEEVAGAAEGQRQASPPPTSSPVQPPAVSASHTDPASAPSRSSTSSSPSETRSQLSVDRRLEETLSGVLGTPKPRKRTSSSRASGAGELDALISRTLSGVVSKPSKPRPSVDRPRAEAPQLDVVPEPELAPPVRTAPLPTVERNAPFSTPLPPIVSPARPSPVASSPSRVSAEDVVDALAQSIGRASPRPTERSVSEPPDEAASTTGEAVSDRAPADAAEPSSTDIYGTMRLPIARKSKATTAPIAPKESQFAAESKPPDRVPPSEEAAATSPASGTASDGDRQRFGQYQLLDRIAVGGMAEVWKARMQGVEGFQKNVAIKRILPHLTDSSDFLTMFIDEAKLAAQLNHPNIVHIYDLGKIEDDYYIAMEYIAGKDLRTILNEGRTLGKPLPLGLAVLIASRLASGLDHAHRKRDFDNRDLGLVHRDVSPQNVLVSYSGDIKLCDFGIAKAVAKASKTQMGALKGKLQYMSPEQAWGRVVDARSDIFSLGAVLFEMLTGERLFAGESEISVLESVREGKVRGVRNIAGQVPVELDAVVAKALAKDPDERFQSAGEMQQELEAILYSLKPTPVEATLTEYMRSIFGEEAEDESGESQEIVVDLAPTPSVLPEKAGEVAAVAPRGKSADADEAGSSMGLWLGLAVALLVLAGVAWYLMAGRAGVGEGSPQGPPPTEAAPASDVAPLGGVSADPETATEAGAIEGSEEGTEGAAPGVTEGAEASAAERPSEDAVLAAMVDEQVKAREAELERQQDTARKELETQLEETRLAAEQAEQEAATRSAALEEETAAAEAPVESEPEPPVSEDETPVATGSGPTGDSADQGALTPPQPTATPPVVTPQPKPAEVEPAPAEAAPPAKPRYQEGQLVPNSTAGLIAPRLVSVETPQYPPVARRMKVQGTVVVAALVNEKGQVIETRLVQGVKQNVGLNEAAERAVRSARFQPATIEGVRVQTWFNLSVPFKL